VQRTILYPGHIGPGEDGSETESFKVFFASPSSSKNKENYDEDEDAKAKAVADAMSPIVGPDPEPQDSLDSLDRNLAAIMDESPGCTVPDVGSIGSTLGQSIADEVLADFRNKMAPQSQDDDAATVPGSPQPLVPPCSSSSSSVSMAHAPQVAPPTDPGRSEIPKIFQVNPNRNKNIVTNIAESFMFQADSVDRVHEDNIADVRRAASECDYLTISEAFVGVSATTVAKNSVVKALSDKLGTPVTEPPVLWMFERDPKCLAELLPYCKKKNICLHGEISDLWADDLIEKKVISQLRRKPQMAIEVLAPRISAGTSVKRSAYCHTHGGKCCLKTAWKHVAGVLCTPWSQKGLQMGAQDPDILFTLAWIGQRVLLQEPEFTTENTRTHVPSEDLRIFKCLTVALRKQYFIPTLS
jgi:hypothetical protein